MNHPFLHISTLLLTAVTAVLCTSCRTTDYSHCDVLPVAPLQGVAKQGYQGMAIHDDYLVSLQNTGQATIYQLHSDTILFLRQFPLASTHKVNHSNVACFGNERYSADDTFPLLYVSQCSRQLYNGLKDVCFVERISLDAPAQLVQTIVLDDPGHLFGYALQWIIDNRRGLLIGYGNTIENLAEGNRWRMMIFRLPRLSEGAEVHLRPEDALENYCIQDLDARYPSQQIGQGACIIGRQMFIPVGLGTAKQPSILYVWNLRTRRLDHILNFQSQVPHEFEDIAPHGRDLLLQTNGTGVIRL
ncbi:MAG: hypothetical protein K6C30_01690, partial [Bacteroidaceae bacterium]|nr:hypothetical protein [Bacteroidaceae bacterium]